MLLWGVTWLPLAPMQMELRALAPDTILLQPEGAQRILRDTAELSALHNVSYQLLAGSPAPQKSKWSWTLWVCVSQDGLAPTLLLGQRGAMSSIFGWGPAYNLLQNLHSLHCLLWGWRSWGNSTCSIQGPSFCALDWGDHRCFGFPRLLWGGLQRSISLGLSFQGTW